MDDVPPGTWAEIEAVLVDEAEAAASGEPRKGPFDDPAVPPQPLAGLDAPPRRARGAPWGGRAVRLVGVRLREALPRPPRPAARADDGRDGVDQREEPSRVVGIGGREADGQGTGSALAKPQKDHTSEGCRFGRPSHPPPDPTTTAADLAQPGLRLFSVTTQMETAMPEGRSARRTRAIR